MIADLALTYFQCRLAASALERLGDPRKAAESVFANLRDGFEYAGSTTRSRPVSPNAILLEGVTVTLAQEIAQHGIPAVCVELRKLR